jgi:tetratricopeptide (TPR) repeat protein
VARRGRGRGLRLLVRGTIVVLLVILGGWGFMRWRVMRDRGPATGAVRIARDAAGTARMARAAEERGDLEKALAIYREGVRRFPSDPVLLGSYGTATTNRSFAVRTNRGRLMPLAATSRERTTAAQEALRLLDAAQQANPRLSQPALQKGLLYAAWGLPEDALVELYAAVVRGDRSPALERTAGAITRLQLGRADSLGALPDQNGRPARR